MHLITQTDTGPDRSRIIFKNKNNNTCLTQTSVQWSENATRNFSCTALEFWRKIPAGAGWDKSALILD